MYISYENIEGIEIVIENTKMFKLAAQTLTMLPSRGTLIFVFVIFLNSCHFAHAQDDCKYHFSLTIGFIQSLSSMQTGYNFDSLWGIYSSCYIIIILFIMLSFLLHSSRVLARIFITGCPKWVSTMTGCPNRLTQKN